jgi:hypothetical protein
MLVAVLGWARRVEELAAGDPCAALRNVPLVTCHAAVIAPNLYAVVSAVAAGAQEPHPFEVETCSASRPSRQLERVLIWAKVLPVAARPDQDSSSRKPRSSAMRG